MVIGIVELYCGKSGKKGFYNNQEIGLARAYKRQGDSVFIFYPNKGAKEQRQEKVEDGIIILYVPAKTIGDHSRYDWSVLLSHHVEMVQIDCDNQIFAGSLMRFCKKMEIPYYAYLGTVGSDSDYPLKRLVMRILFYDTKRLLKKSRCFAKTPEVEQALLKMGAKDVTVAPVGLDTSIIPLINKDRLMLRTGLGLSKDKKILLFVGRLETYKRPELAVELLEFFDKDYELIMIGCGSMSEKIRKLASAGEVSGRIRLIERIENSQIHEYFAACDYIVNFNEKEIFGMTILEAMYQGGSVIAFHAPGPDLIIEDGVSGFLVDDIGQMRDIIAGGKKIDPDVAKKRIEEEFSWDSTVRVIYGNIHA